MNKEGVRAESQPAESKVKQNGDVKVKRDEASTATKRARCVHTSNGGEVSSPRARRTPTVNALAPVNTLTNKWLRR